MRHFGVSCVLRQKFKEGNKQKRLFLNFKSLADWLII